MEPKDVPQVFEQLSDAPFGAAITMETDVVEEEAEEPSPPPKARPRATPLLGQVRVRARRHCRCPRILWDARLGYFGIGPAEVGELTPAQLLGCVDLFSAMHGGGE